MPARPQSIRALAASLLLGAAACTSNAPTVFVQANLDPALPPVDQLAFEVSKAGAATLGPSLRPDPASSEPLAPEQSVRLVLPEAYAGTVTVRVQALSGGTAVGSGSSDGLARSGAETTVVVNVGLQTTCDPTTCPDGCCANGVCVKNAINLCGTGAGTCSACDPVASDRCDRGACRCGSGPECAAGQTCTNGGCRCDPSTCPGGCCDGNTCLPGNTDAQCGAGGSACSACTTGPGCDGGVCGSCIAGCDAGCCSGSACLPNSLAACGSGGAACSACDARLADRCVGGQCSCGSGPQCGAGQLCLGGSCQCNSSSCPRGCCQANQCMAPGPANCGIDGGACTACSTTRADSCSLSGACACGSGAACPTQGTCVGGACICDGGACTPPCDATSCPNGCCSGGVCLPSTLSTCGRAGAACVDCSLRGNTCSAAGVCTCSGNPMCAAGQRCSSTAGGSCVCDAASGCAGCCAGDTCTASSYPASCGANGANCASCSPTRADRCLNGSCSCGTSGAPCSGNKSCDGGTCI